MYETRLESTRKGGKVLLVYYHSERTDWDEAIAWAREHHGVDCTGATVIALPTGTRLENRRAEIKPEAVEAMFEGLLD
jgi:hypothetical protein